MSIPPERQAQNKANLKWAQEKIAPFREEEKLNKVLLSLKKFVDEASGLTKKMDDSKFKKGVKELGKTFKSMIAASVQGALLEMLFSILGPTIELLSMFSPIFEALGLVLMSLFLPAMQDLMPYIIMLTKAIIALIPYTSALYGLLKDGLLWVFNELSKIIIPIVFVIDALTVAWKWLMDNALTPVYNFLMGYLEPAFAWLLTNALQPIYDFLEDYFIWQLETLYDTFEDLYEVAKDAWKEIEKLVGWIMSIEMPSWLGGGGGGGGSGGGDDDDDDDEPINDWWDIADPNHILPGHAAGGITTGASIGRIGEAGSEAIIPLERKNPFIDAIENLAYAQEQTLRVLEEIRDNQSKTNTLNRRAFG